MAVFPQEDLALDQAAVAIEGGDGAHFIFGERVSGDAGEVGAIVVDGEGNGCLPALDGPLDANHGGMNSVALGDTDDHRVFSRRGVFRRAVAFRPSRRSDGAIADGLHAIFPDETEELGLLKVRMQLHFVHGGFDARVAEH